jgi:hypothetical protein
MSAQREDYKPHDLAGNKYGESQPVARKPHYNHYQCDKALVEGRSKDACDGCQGATVSLCNDCGCVTKTFDGVCGKCWAVKGEQMEDADVTREQRIKFNILVPLVSTILSKRGRERYSTTRGDESLIYGKAVSEVMDEVEKAVVEATRNAYDLLYWKYKEINGQSVDVKFVEAYNALMDETAATNPNKEDTN